MTETTVTYSLTIFGVTILRWTRSQTVPVPVVDEEALYQKFAKRFGQEMNDALVKMRGGSQ